MSMSGGEVDALQLSLPVDRRQARPPRPAEPILRTATIDGLYRYDLVRAWGAGPRLLIAGLNPSTADGTKDDPTIWREIGFAFRWGFGSLVKINLEPYVTSRPERLLTWRAFRDQDASSARIKNFAVCGAMCRRADLHLAAWGAGADPGVLDLWLQEARRVAGRPIPWHCLGTNADGSPRHTLARGCMRIPDDARPVPWVRP